MGRKSRRKDRRSAEPAPAEPRAPEPALPEPPSRQWVDPGLAALVGGALLALLFAFDLTGPTRAPRSTDLVLGFSAAVGLAGVIAFALRRRIGDHLPAWLLAGGLGVLAVASGLAPELFAWPMRGIGERLWGFPIIVGAPLAGAGLLAGGRRGLTAGGVGCALLLAGLLQPYTNVLVLRAAVLYHLDPWGGLPSGGTVTLLLLAVLGIGAIPSGAARPDSPLPRVAGGLLLAFMLAWQVARLASGGGATAAAALMITVATTLWILAALPPVLSGIPAFSRRWVPTLVEAGALLTLVALWLMLKSFTWRWSTTDENIYFYDAVLMTRGQLPYRDFFFAHPPLHIALPALLFGIFGFSLSLAKAIPVVAALATGGLIWHLARRAFGPVAGFLTLGAFLFAHELLQASTNLNGVNLTSLWLTAGLVLLIRGRPTAAGVTLGLAVATGFYAIAGALAALVLGLFAPDRRGWKAAMWFAGVAGGINLICYLIGGDAFVEAVYRYHGEKEEKPLTAEFIKTLYHHGPLAMGVLLAPVAGAWQRFRGFALPLQPAERELRGSFFSPEKLWTEPRLGAIKVAWLVCVALLVEFTMFQELYSFYFALIFPTAAICTGYVVTVLIAAVTHELGRLAAGRGSAAGWVAPALVVAWAMWVPLTAEANWIFSASGPPPERVPGKGVNPEFLRAGEKRGYRWIEPAVWPEVVGPVARALFWRDHRLRADVTPGYRHFLWQKSLHLDAAEAITDYVREHSEPGETVAGNSLVAPFVALAAERRIAANFVDTNAKRFKTGLSSVEDFFEKICADDIRFIVSAPSGYISDRLLVRLPTVRRYFERVEVFPSLLNKFERRVPWAVSLWRLRDPAGEPRCTWIEPPPPRRRRR